MRARACTLLRAVVRSEDGVAVPTVMMLVIAASALGMVSVMGSISVQQGSVRDHDSKSALAAADAGVNRALWRQNKMPPGAGFFCAGNATASAGWCPAYTGQVGDATWSYQVSVPDAGGMVEIVSTGASDGVNRKVSLLSRLNTGADVFGGERVITKDWIDMDSNSEINVNVGTNGWIHLDSNSEICGGIRHGEGEDVTFDSNSGQCAGYPLVAGDRELPPIFKPGLADPANNDNDRFFGADIRTGGSNVSWNPTTRVLSMNSNSTLTMGGRDYFICRLVMDSNSRLYMAAGAKVRIYFDTPENCGLAANTAQIDMRSNTEVSSTSWNPELGNFDLLGFYMFGSPNVATRAQFNSNANVTSEFVLYAPYTDIDMNSNTTYIGAVAGKTLHMDSNAQIISHVNMPPPLIDSAPFFAKNRYVECATTVTGAPDAGC